MTYESPKQLEPHRGGLERDKDVTHMHGGRPRKLTDEQRKARKAAEQRKRRASDKGKAWTREYYQRPEVKLKKKENNKLPKNRDHIRNWELNKDFGITLADYNRMLDEQEGVCMICKLPEYNRRLAVDHCHETGKVRGLLCGSCNRGLGLFRDNCVMLENAIKYLNGN